ncbi:hypothetical protein DERP_008750 [Dermatophagoides pteronyssinus]|uniref:Uncharacterized protein n=1 Tax=Dermatophagoides pteronyssinus TaxID=6956 RepID=A0ABQ8IW67_DERPT|nr:hypothetical protein DERP_008750 [Dermatophagoides pteronyssinus]
MILQGKNALLLYDTYINPILFKNDDDDDDESVRKKMALDGCDFCKLNGRILSLNKLFLPGGVGASPRVRAINGVLDECKRNNGALGGTSANVCTETISERGPVPRVACISIGGVSGALCSVRKRNHFVKSLCPKRFTAAKRILYNEFDRKLLIIVCRIGDDDDTFELIIFSIGILIV